MPLQACRAGTAFLVLGALLHTTVVLHRRSNAPYQCEMTYMHPSYERVDADSKLSRRYGLFRYRDTEAAVAPHGAQRIIFASVLIYRLIGSDVNRFAHSSFRM
jgi:hypothetical protein